MCVGSIGYKTGNKAKYPKEYRKLSINTREVHCGKFNVSRHNTVTQQIHCSTLIPDFRRDVDEICALLGCYAGSCGNCLSTFRNNVSVPSSRVKSRDS
jgi:hypothetical protein